MTNIQKPKMFDCSFPKMNFFAACAVETKKMASQKLLVGFAYWFLGF